jgi:hypothetical protein
MGSTYFTFLAKKAGTTTIVFQTTVNELVFLGMDVGGNTIITPLNITVEDCSYKVDMLGRWQVPGEANINILARFKEAGMFEDNENHYTGTANVVWAISAGQVGDCTATFSEATSEVNLQGTVYGPEEFTFVLTFQPTFVTETANCRGIVQSLPLEFTVLPTSFSVSAYGGYGRELQNLVLNGNTLGTIIVTVRRTGAP